MSRLWDIEQYLQDNDCFVNGINGKTCHMDSYMTVIVFEKIEPAIANSPFTLDEWKEAIDNWKSLEYISPIIGLTWRIAKRILKIEDQP